MSADSLALVMFVWLNVMMLESTLVNGSCFKCAIEIKFVLLYCIVMHTHISIIAFCVNTY